MQWLLACMQACRMRPAMTRQGKQAAAGSTCSRPGGWQPGGTPRQPGQWPTVPGSARVRWTGPGPDLQPHTAPSECRSHVHNSATCCSAGTQHMLLAGLLPLHVGPSSAAGALKGQRARRLCGIPAGCMLPQAAPGCSTGKRVAAQLPPVATGRHGEPYARTAQPGGLTCGHEDHQDEQEREELRSTALSGAESRCWKACAGLQAGRRTAACSQAASARFLGVAGAGAAASLSSIQHGCPGGGSCCAVAGPNPA